MNTYQIVGIFLGVCSLYCTLVQLLWSIFTYLKKRGYYCVCEQACTSDDNTSDTEESEVDEDIITSRLFAQLDVKETWV